MHRNSGLYGQYAAQTNNRIRDSEPISPVHASIDPRFSSLPSNRIHSPSPDTINSNAWLPKEVPNKKSEDVPKKNCLPPVWKSRLQGLLVGLAVAAVSVGIILGVLLTRPSISSTTDTTTTPCSSFQWNQVSVSVAGNGSFGSAPEQLSNPMGIYVDSNYALYVADYFNHRVQKWLPNAVSGTTVAGITGFRGSNGSLLDYPRAVYVDAQHNLYVADNNFISKWSRSTLLGIQVPNSSVNVIGYVNSIFVDTSGNLYVSCPSYCVVRMWTPTATASIIVAGRTSCGSSSSQLTGSYGFTINSLANTVYIANGNAHTVIAWPVGATNGTIIAGRNFTYGAAEYLLSNPRDVKLDQYGNLYILDTANNRVLLLCQNPPSTGTRIIGGYRLSNPPSMALDADLNLHVPSNNQIQKYTRIV